MNNEQHIQDIIRMGKSADLAENLSKYPYASIFHLAALANSPNDPALVAAAAFRVSNHRFLYNLIRNIADANENKIAISETTGNKQQKTIEKYEAEIEKFIQEEPRISIDRNTAPPKDDLAEKSIKNNEEIISETLAEILYNQGKKVKAIDFYEKLSLKFPEKSSYFAVRIEKIKQEL